MFNVYEFPNKNIKINVGILVTNNNNNVGVSK